MTIDHSYSKKINITYLMDFSYDRHYPISMPTQIPPYWLQDHQQPREMGHNYFNFVKYYKRLQVACKHCM